MRKELKKLNEKRITILAVAERFGEKSSFRGPPKKTIMFRDVKLLEEDKIVADHIWFTCGKWSESICLGDIITMQARVKKYQKGYMGYRDDVYDAPISIDYKLSNPSKVIKLS